MQADSARVLVLCAPAAAARSLLTAAAARGMTRKGWSWVGDGRWVRPGTWLQQQAEEAAAGGSGGGTPPLAAAMTGALGVTPSPPSSLVESLLGRFRPASALLSGGGSRGFFAGASLTPLSDAALPFPPPPSGAAAAAACPELLPWNASGAAALSLPPDGWAPAVFEAVCVAAGAVADSLALASQRTSSPSPFPLANLTRAMVAETLRRGVVSRPSPLSGGAPLSFLPNGDRAAASLALVNVLAGGAGIAAVGTWTSTAAAVAAPRPPNASVSLPPPWPGGVAYTAAGSIIAGDGDASAGVWGPLRAITWPGGSLEVPPDRALEHSHALAIALAVILGGVGASLLVGAILHDA